MGEVGEWGGGEGIIGDVVVGGVEGELKGGREEER